MNGRKLTVLTAIAGILAVGEFGSAIIIGLGKDPWGAGFAVVFGVFFLLAAWLLRSGRVIAGVLEHESLIWAHSVGEGFGVGYAPTRRGRAAVEADAVEQALRGARRVRLSRRPANGRASCRSPEQPGQRSDCTPIVCRAKGEAQRVSFASDDWEMRSWIACGNRRGVVIVCRREFVVVGAGLFWSAAAPAPAATCWMNRPARLSRVIG